MLDRDGCDSVCVCLCVCVCVIRMGVVWMVRLDLVTKGGREGAREEGRNEICE